MSFRVEDLDDLRKHIHIDRNMIFYEERKSSCVECHSELTLLGLGGGHIGPTLAPEAILFESPCRAHSETKIAQIICQDGDLYQLFYYS